MIAARQSDLMIADHTIDVARDRQIAATPARLIPATPHRAVVAGGEFDQAEGAAIRQLVGKRVRLRWQSTRSA